MHEMPVSCEFIFRTRPHKTSELKCSANRQILDMLSASPLPCLSCHPNSFKQILTIPRARKSVLGKLRCWAEEAQSLLLKAAATLSLLCHHYLLRCHGKTRRTAPNKKRVLSYPSNFFSLPHHRLFVPMNLIKFSFCCQAKSFRQRW